MPKKMESAAPKRGRPPKSASEPRQKTSISFPVSALTLVRLWAAARGIDAQDIVVEALQEKLERERAQIERDVQASLSAKK